jgi:hypothetical protein
LLATQVTTTHVQLVLAALWLYLIAFGWLG